MPDSDMQEKRNKQLSILLLVLLTTTVLAYAWLNRDGHAVEIDKGIFKTEDLQQVNEIVLQSAENKVEIKYLGSRWKVNGKYDVDQNRIDALFFTLRQAEPKRPVPGSQRDSVGRELEAKGVKVTLVSGGKAVNEFWAGGNDLKSESYYKKASSAESYVMVIPGYRVYTSGIFELSEKEWRDKYVFGFNWRNFQSLEVKFPGNAAEGFRVKWDDQYTGIEGMPQADTAKLNNYLDAVSLLRVDEYLDDSTSVDSLKAVSPVLTLDVREVSGTSYTLKLYAVGNARFLGLIDDHQWAVFSPSKVRAILRPKRFFNKE